jgi:hypothetical protein
MFISSYPAAKLMEFCQAEAVGIIYKNGIGIWDIEAGFDYSRTDQDIGFAEDEIYHSGFELSFAHLAVGDIEFDFFIAE